MLMVGRFHARSEDFLV